MVNQSNYEETLKRVLVENTAQGVHKYLTELDSNRKDRHTRWIWELLQNARDVSAADNSLTAEVRYNPGKPGELIFLHDGRGFKMDEIVHLIFYGSTKHEDPNTLGQFGSGFLTTHLLSWEIEVSGLLDDGGGQWFNFTLARKPESVGTLYKSMEQAGSDFNESLTLTRPESIPASFTTRFVYTISDIDAAEAVDTGLKTLKQCAPYVVVFNKEFSSISIKTPNETHCFEVPERPSLDTAEIPHQITVRESKNENSNQRNYLLTSGTQETSVVVPLKSDSNGMECLSIDKIPRLFLGFPLVGTEAFSFPAVINSFNFTALENRDGVPLGQSDNEANLTNQSVIEEACALLVKMLKFAGSTGWKHVHLLANVPPFQPQNGLNIDWLKEDIQPKFIEEIRQIPAVITQSGKLIEPSTSLLPAAENDEGIEVLWDLLNDWQDLDVRLPRRDEAIGWYKAIESWAKVLECDVLEINGAINGNGVASTVHKISHDPSDNTGSHRVSNLKLREGISAINWLDRLIDFLQNHRLGEVIDKYHIIPSQAGLLFPCSSLFRDAGIDEELKSIADLLDKPIRAMLRDTRLNSLSKIVGRGDKEHASVATELLEELKNRAQRNLNEKFKDASTRLFAWIVGQKNYSALWAYPVFTADSKSVCYLPSSIQDSVRPLSPIRTWSADLQQFSDLFPPNSILNDAFFEKVPDRDTWQILSKDGFIRRSIRTTSHKRVNFKDIYPEESLPDGDSQQVNHTTINHISVTDIEERTSIMDHVSNSRSRALVFWRFLTEWLIKEDSQGLVLKETQCSCGASHKYYPAEWLMPVRNNRWIRYGDLHPIVDASSLTKMLRDNEWKLDALKENSETVKLLEAIGITEFDFLREFAAENDEERNAQDQIFRDILVETGGDLNQIGYLRQILETVGGDVSEVTEIVQDLQEDESLKQDLEKLRERRHIIKKNRNFGNQVEEIVGQILEKKYPKEEFCVKSVHEGADFEISEIEVTQGNQKWWIEVKSTQTEGDFQVVKMSSTQGKKAVKEKDKFLLCVVPIPKNTELNLDTVKENMRFIANIGERVAPLCENINQFETVRAKITADVSPDVKLVVDGDKPSILVKKSVWEEDGFRLEKLTEYLKPIYNDNAM